MTWYHIQYVLRVSFPYGKVYVMETLEAHWWKSRKEDINWWELPFGNTLAQDIQPITQGYQLSKYLTWIHQNLRNFDPPYTKYLKKSFKTSLKAFSHQRRAKPFNTLRSKRQILSKKNMSKIFILQIKFDTELLVLLGPSRSF